MVCWGHSTLISPTTLLAENLVPCFFVALGLFQELDYFYFPSSMEAFAPYLITFYGEDSWWYLWIPKLALTYEYLVSFSSSRLFFSFRWGDWAMSFSCHLFVQRSHFDLRMLYLCLEVQFPGFWAFDSRNWNLANLLRSSDLIPSC